MRITTVHFERKRSDGQYGNRSLSLTAELEDGEDVTLAIESLALVIRERLDADEHRDEEERQRRDEELRARYAAERKARVFLPEDDEPEPDEDNDEEREPSDDEIPY